MPILFLPVHTASSAEWDGGGAKLRYWYGSMSGTDTYSVTRQDGGTEDYSWSFELDVALGGSYTATVDFTIDRVQWDDLNQCWWHSEVRASGNAVASGGPYLDDDPDRQTIYYNPNISQWETWAPSLGLEGTRHDYGCGFDLEPTTEWANDGFYPGFGVWSLSSLPEWYMQGTLTAFRMDTAPATFPATQHHSLTESDTINFEQGGTETWTATTVRDYSLTWNPAPLEPDADGDGVADDADACPVVYGETVSGCPPAAADFTARWIGESGSDHRVQLDGSGSAGVDLVYHWDFGDGTTGVGVMPEHTYIDPGLHEVTLTVIDRANQSAMTTANVVGNPVYHYAPAVHLHPDEEYFPMDPGKFFRKSSLWWNHDWACSNEPIATAKEVTAAKLKAGRWSHRAALTDRCVVAGKSYGSDALTAPARKGDSKKASPGREGFYLNAPKSVWRGVEPADASYSNAPRLYYEHTSNKYIVYWLFYGLSGRLGDKHEGDWERIVVRLNERDVISQSAYFQHYCDPLDPGATYGLRDHPETLLPNNIPQDYPHLDVWSALGGHPHFPQNVGTEKLPCNDFRKGAFDRTADGGFVWETWKGGLTDARKQSWYGLGVGWGDKVSTGLGYGPLGPGRLMDRSDGPAAPRPWM